MEHEPLFEQAPLPDEILSDIESVQGPIIRKLNQWLSTLEGQCFLPEETKKVVAQVRSLVAKAGCEILFEGTRASITCSASRRSKSGTFRVFSAEGGGSSNRLYSKSAFPPLSVRSIPMHNDGI